MMIEMNLNKQATKLTNEQTLRKWLSSAAEVLNVQTAFLSSVQDIRLPFLSWASSLPHLGSLTHISSTQELSHGLGEVTGSASFHLSRKHLGFMECLFMQMRHSQNFKLQPMIFSYPENSFPLSKVAVYPGSPQIKCRHTSPPQIQLSEMFHRRLSIKEGLHLQRSTAPPSRPGDPKAPPVPDCASSSKPVGGI